MSVRTVALLGEPATGKSTLVRALLATVGPLQTGAHRTCRYLCAPGLVVLGTYEPDQPYPGTDRLSMAVLPDALDLLDTLTRRPGATTLLFEGDRLAVRPFLAAAQAAGPLVVVRLIAPKPILAARLAARADTKPESFLKGRRTKLDRLAALFPLTSFDNAEPADLERNLDRIRTTLGPAFASP